MKGTPRPIRAGDWFTSTGRHQGGHLEAQVVSVSRECVVLMRNRRPGGLLQVRFVLPRTFFASPACGWRREGEPVALIASR